MSGACGCSGQSKAGIPCGCCTGVHRLTPRELLNRPGLDALQYRVATYGTALATMKARLSGADLEALRFLTTRATDDPAIALLDAWAMVADVLTFYQERIANEGYLRTATERHSVLELARLVGYAARPGVAASVYLAYTLEAGSRVMIPAGSRAQSVPGPGELPQSFETAEALEASDEWNDLRPRQKQPLMITGNTRVLWFDGLTTGLRRNDVLLVDGVSRLTMRVLSVEVQPLEQRTKVVVEPLTEQPNSTDTAAAADAVPRRDEELLPAHGQLPQLTASLSIAPSQPPPSSARLARDLPDTFRPTGGIVPALVEAFRPEVGPQLHAAIANAVVTPPPSSKVYAFRVVAAPFGHNAPQQAKRVERQIEFDEWDFKETDPKVLTLDSTYDQILPRSWVLISPGPEGVRPRVTAVNDVRRVSRADYGLAAQVTELTLAETWRPKEIPDLGGIRGITVYAQSEELTLAEEPILEPVCGGRIEMGRLYSGLESGRWLIVTGERTDTPNTSGVMAGELVMLAGVDQDVQRVPTDSRDEAEGAEPGTVVHAPRPGDRTHTFLRLADDLAYCYRRDTVRIFGNVARATHGDSRSEMLGHGDGTRPFQSFTLRQRPLTHVSAATASGIRSTLEVRANDVLWHEVEELARLGPTDRRYVTRRDAEDATTVTFGDGRRGARLPTGIENVRAAYRTGIGKAGNVRPEQVTLLTTRPLGVKAVTNPLRASGGADREGLDQARRHAPLVVTALGRLVSTKDYEDFARTFAGVGKASAIDLPRAGRRTVHLTIAGADDIPIDEGSDLLRHLREALHRFGDPYVPVDILVRELRLLVLEATVGVKPDHEWDVVEPNVRELLLLEFGFARRELGQSVRLSEIVSVIHRVEGVRYVDVDVLDTISEAQVTKAPTVLAARLKPSASLRRPGPPPVIRAERPAPLRAGPEELLIFSPDVTDTLILHGVTS